MGPDSLGQRLGSLLRDVAPDCCCTTACIHNPRFVCSFDRRPVIKTGTSDIRDVALHDDISGELELLVKGAIRIDHEQPLTLFISINSH